MHNKIYTLKLSGVASCYMWPMWSTVARFFPNTQSFLHHCFTTLWELLQVSRAHGRATHSV